MKNPPNSDMPTLPEMEQDPSKNSNLSKQDACSLYHVIFDESPSPMWIVDPRSLRFLFVNRATLNQYGYSEMEFLQITLSDLRIPGAPARVTDPLVASTMQESHRTKYGKDIDLSIRIAPVVIEGRPATL